MSECKGCGSRSRVYIIFVIFWLSDISREGIQTTSHIGYYLTFGELKLPVLLWHFLICSGCIGSPMGLQRPRRRSEPNSLRMLSRSAVRFVGVRRRWVHHSAIPESRQKSCWPEN